jgi:hypothetical protein
VWRTDRTFRASDTGATREHLIHLLDKDSPGSYTFHFRVEDHVAPAITALEDLSGAVQTTAVDGLNITFSEEIDLATFGPADFTLTKNGAAVDLAGLAPALTLVGGTVYHLGGLAPVTAGDGNYDLTFDAHGMTDLVGNAGANAMSSHWAMGAAAPVILDVQQPASPRTNAMASLDVVFSRTMNAATFDFNDLALTLNGVAVTLDAGVSVAPLAGNSFRVAGLDAFTAADGDYVLTMLAAGTTDDGGIAGVGQFSRAWRKDSAGPQVAAVEHLATDPRNIVVMSLDVNFTEAIAPASFDWHDITLTRNGGANLITDAVSVAQVDADTYRITGFNWVVGQPGEYVLTVNAAGINDLAGNAGSGSGAETWVMDTVDPAAPTGLAITPDNGVSDTDGRTNTLDITLTGNLSETGLTVRLADVTSNTDLGYAAVTGTTFSGSFTLSGAGAHKLRARAVDAAGNTADSFFDVFVDTTAPGVASLSGVSPNPRTAPLDTLDVTLDEAVTPGCFTYVDLALTKDGAAVPLNPSVSVALLSGNTYRVAGLTGFTGEAGAYRLTAAAAGLTDRVGNTGVGSKSAEWIMSTSQTPGSIQGVCFDDTDGDGVVDTGEPPLAGRTVFLDADADGALDAGEVSVTSGADGAFAFNDLTPGAYRVAQVRPAGWLLTAPAAGYYDVNLAEGQSAAGRDFANFQPGIISGVKFHDLNANGVKDAGEPALAGWTIFIDADRDGVLDASEQSLVTAQDGAFAFTGIGPGMVLVGELPQAGWQRTTPEALHRVRSGYTAVADVGNVQLASISGIKYNDLDGDGQRDPGEPGLAGWTIFLDRDADGALDPDETSTTTDADGRYSFTGLLPGAYTVAEVQQAGWTQTSPVSTVPGSGSGVSTTGSQVNMETLGTR